MPRYADDQCEECGAPRVARSKLCGDCLVRRLAMEMRESLIKKRLIERYEAKIKRDEGRLEDALAYGFKQNQENAKLYQQIERLVKHIGGGRKDEEDRKGENTEGEEW